MVLLSVFLQTSAQSASDTAHVLEGVEVVSSPTVSGVRREGTRVSVSSPSLLRGMRALGESDAIGALRMLPGVSSGSDYASGISVNGAPLSQTSYSVDGTPVFYPFHFGGIFSTFNTPHFKVFRLDMDGGDYRSVMRAGAAFQALTSDMVGERAEGTADVGILASSLTMRVPCGRNTAVIVSGRTSYIDMLLSGMVDTDDASVRYSFTDANLTLIHRHNDNDLLKVNGFVNTDRVKFADRVYAMDTRLRWLNALGNAVWTHTVGDRTLSLRLGCSHADSRMDVDMPQIAVGMPSSLTQLEANADFSNAFSGWSIGGGAEFTCYTPQHSAADEAVDGSTPVRHYRSLLGHVYADRMWPLASGIDLETGARVSVFSSDQHDIVDLEYKDVGVYCRIDPRLALIMRRDAHTLRLQASTQTQYVQQVGFSDIGFSSNFWIPSTKSLSPLQSIGCDIAYNVALGRLSVDATLFAKYIRHEAEYRGGLLQILMAGYDSMVNISQSNGYNTGGSVMLTYSGIRLSGWIGYSLAVCRRQFAGEKERWLPSATEPLHSLKLSGRLSLSNMISVSGFFTLASGRRYTPVEAIYIVGSNVLTEYGPRNSATLPLYHRLDLSATCSLRDFSLCGCKVSSFLNLSIINAYGHRNTEMQSFVYNREANTVSLHRITSLYRFLPSLSYTIQF